ncbi:RNA 2',3'-cyclic phosphodiesterase [Anaerolineales bacterium]
MARLFVAIDLPEHIKQQLLEVRNGSTLPAARWVDADQFHLTLHFIGETPAAKMADYKGVLGSIKQEAFDLQFSGIGQFPPDGEGPARVLWVGVANSPALRELYAATGYALKTHGFQVDGQRYHPHITLARFKQSPRRGWLSKYIDQWIHYTSEPFQVDSFALYSSDRRHSGSVYTQEAVYPLKK